MTTHRLRYTGEQAAAFQTGRVGYIEPGGEFSVPDDLLVSFMRRADVEHAGECPAPPCRCDQEPQAPDETVPPLPARRSRASASAGSPAADTP